jgi:hypothetical protein
VMRPDLACLFGRWIHSHEEDAEGTRTYRPTDWSLPLSRRPRHVLEFDADARLVSRVGGPSDAYSSHEGRWAAKLGTPLLVLEIAWQDSSPPAELEVVACLEDLLQIKVTRGSID